MKTRLLLISAALFLLTACPGNAIETTTIHYYTIDGMPCIQMGTAIHGGITCDWSKWDGTQERKITKH